MRTESNTAQELAPSGPGRLWLLAAAALGVVSGAALANTTNISTSPLATAS